MIAPDKPKNESSRLQALCDLDILDTDSEQRFDRITRVATALFDVPIALVSLVDTDRQWFKSRQGVDATETPRDISFCGHAILADRIFNIPDATQDDRFRDNPLVTGPLNLRFYAGVPLHAPTGYLIGTLCIIDRKPKTLTSEQLQLLKDLAEGIEVELAQKDLRELSERLTSSENRIKAIVNTVVDGIITINETGIVQSANPATEKLFGRSASEIIGQNVNMLMPKPYAGEHDGYLENYRNTGIKKIIGVGREVQGLRKNGTVFPMYLAVSELQADGEKLYTGIVRDISEQRAAEAAVIEKNKILERVAAEERTQTEVLSLFNKSNDLDFIFPAVLNLLEKSHQFVVSAIYVADEWQGVYKSVASHGLANKIANVYRPGEGIVGQAALNAETIVVPASAESPIVIDTGVHKITPAETIALPISYGKAILGVLVLASIKTLQSDERDFLERLVRQVGVSLNNVNQVRDLQSLSEKLKHRSQEVSTKNYELTRANRLKTEFLANMSHELRTPLNAIIGFSEVLSHQVLGTLNEQQLDYAIEVLDSANHLLTLINDILDLSKMEAGTMQLYPQQLNLEELLRNALKIVKERAHDKKIELHLDIDDELGDVCADGRKLKQVMFNLLSNAIKFTPEGGHVNVLARSHAGLLEIAVKDTGIGIAAEKCEHIFQPFEQIDGSLSRRYAGTGLGLAMVKKVVELHNGKVTVTSKLGQGSCFEIALPLYSEQEMLSDKGLATGTATSDTASLSNSDSCTGGHDNQREQGLQENSARQVMIVGEKVEWTGIIRECLHAKDVVAHEAAHQQQVEVILANKDIDFIIIDLNSYCQDNFALPNTITMSGKNLNVPIALLSPTQTKTGVEIAMADAMLHKPFSAGDLLATVSKLTASNETDVHVLLVNEDPVSANRFESYFLSQPQITFSSVEGAGALAAAESDAPDIIILNLMQVSASLELLCAFKRSKELSSARIIATTSEIMLGQDRSQFYEEIRVSQRNDGVSKSTLQTALNSWC